MSVKHGIDCTVNEGMVAKSLLARLGKSAVILENT